MPPFSHWPVLEPPAGHNNLPDLAETCARKSTASTYRFKCLSAWRLYTTYIALIIATANKKSHLTRPLRWRLLYTHPKTECLIQYLSKLLEHIPICLHLSQFLFCFQCSLRDKNVSLHSHRERNLDSIKCVLFPAAHREFAIAMEMIGKLGFTMAFSTVYCYTAEVYPTVIRNVGMGICSSAARIGSITAPYILFLGMYVLYTMCYMEHLGIVLEPSNLSFVTQPEKFGSHWPRQLNRALWLAETCEVRVTFILAGFIHGTFN